MANKVVSASVKINNRGGNIAGTDDAGKSLKGILDELKNIGGTISKGLKMGNSGLGGFGSGGLLGGLLKVGGAGGALGLGALFSKLLESTGNGMFGDSLMAGGDLGLKGSPIYEKVLMDGQEKVLKIDSKSGEILEILTKEEAIQQGILSKTGELLNKYLSHYSIFDKITSNLPKWRDSVEISADTVGLIQAETQIGLKLEQDINKSRRIIAENLAREARREAMRGTGTTINTSSGQMSIAYDSMTTFERIAQEMNAKSEDPRARALYEQSQESNGYTAPFVNIAFPTSRGP